jgi:hypothetical protein
MVLLKRIDGPVRIGDIAVVSVPDTARSRYGYPPVVIHRIVRISADGTVTTKGDAHKEPDPFTVPRSALSTKVVATLPAGGRVIAFLSSGLGLLWMAGGVVLLFGMPLLERHRDTRQRERGEADDLHASLRSITAELSLLRSDRLDEREALDAATRAAATAREQLLALTAAFRTQMQRLPEQVERAMAAAAAPEPSFLAVLDPPETVRRKRKSEPEPPPEPQPEPAPEPETEPRREREPSPGPIPWHAPVPDMPSTPADVPAWDTPPPAMTRRFSGLVAAADWHAGRVLGSDTTPQRLVALPVRVRT